MRISYSCTANLEKIIKAHNQEVLNKKKTNEGQCNCAGSCKYPLFLPSDYVGKHLKGFTYG